MRSHKIQTRACKDGLRRRAHLPLVAAIIAVLSGCSATTPGMRPTVAQDPKPVDPRVLELAEKAIDDSRYTDAKKLLERVFLADPKNAEARRLAAELTSAQGDSNKALQQFEALANEPDHAGRISQGIGIALLLANEPEKARITLERAVVINPRLWRAWNALGYYFDTKQNWAKSHEAYSRALEASPRPGAVYNNRGYSLLLQKRPAEAATDLSKALTLDPKLDTAKLNLRLALAWQGKYGHALVGAEPKDLSDALNNVGFVALLREDYKHAESYFLRAMQHDAGFHDTASRNLQYLKSLAEIRAETPANGKK